VIDCAGIFNETPKQTDSKTDEQLDALQRVATNQLPTSRPDGAHILDLDGARYVCPWSTSVRTWASLSDFRS
jgi:hypothetical protein